MPEVKPKPIEDTRQHSADRTVIIDALNSVRLQIKNPRKTAKVSFKNTHYGYATLPDIIEQYKPLLSEHGLLLQEYTDCGETYNFLIQELIHVSSMQWIKSQWRIKPKAGEEHPQGESSALTYARRRGFEVLLGIAETDDDAQIASGVNRPTLRLPTDEKIHAVDPDRIGAKDIGKALSPDEEHCPQAGGALKGLPLKNWPSSKIQSFLKFCDEKQKENGRPMKRETMESLIVMRRVIGERENQDNTNESPPEWATDERIQFDN